MTFDTSRPAKEQQRSLFLLVRQGDALPARKSIEGRIGKNQGELKFGDCKTEHVNSDEAAGSHRREELTEPPSVLCDVVDPSQYLVANVETITEEAEPRHLNSFRRRNERLCNQQVRQVRKGESFRRWERKARAIIKRV